MSQDDTNGNHTNNTGFNNAGGISNLPKDSPKDTQNNAPPVIASSPRSTKETTIVQPKHPPLMWQQTQKILQEIGTRFESAVVSYYTRGPIANEDVKYFYTHLKNIGFQDKLYFIIISAGGDGLSAYRIASLLKSFCNELIIVIPEVAASAATMLSLAGEKIIMTSFSYLTAVDTSITHPLNPVDKNKNVVRIQLEEIRRATDALAKTYQEGESHKGVYETIFNHLHPVAYGALERASTLSEMLCRDILNLRKNPPAEEVATSLINKLNKEYPSHGYPITAQKAKSLGLPVEDADTETNNLLWSLLTLYGIITERVRTDYNDSFFRQEQYLNIIESVGRRLSVRNTMERRLDNILKGWTTLRDEYKWESLYEEEENGQMKLKMSNLNL